MKEKDSLRKEMKRQRALMLSEEKELLDSAICRRLFFLIQERQARNIHTFLPMQGEINIFPLIQDLLSQGLTLVAPEALARRRMRNWILKGLDQLQDGVYGTKFPAHSEEYTGTYDLIIVPGLAFDQEKYRVGYGAGYYDTFLEKHAEAFSVGVAYPFQVVDEVPREAHDRALDLLIY
jgi:5-formyltetrahydrofolate cyclo-ligase